MGTRFQRPTDTYAGASGLANRTKYESDATAVPAVPISDTKMDGDFNYVIDGLNTLDDSITSLVAGSIPDGSITTAKLDNLAVTDAKLANSITRTKLATGTANKLVGNDSSGVITDISVGSELTVSSSSLTITSAGITNSKLAAGSVDGSKFSNQSANTVLAGPSSGSSTAPTFRALTIADMPSVAFNHIQVFTSSGTFTPAAGVTKVFVELWGAGGAGGGAVTVNCGGAGGGGGAYSSGFITVTPSTGHTVTIGSGGTGGTGSGISGGTTSFAGASVTASAAGGSGGTGASAFGGPNAGGAGGTASNSGFLNITGQKGELSVISGSYVGYQGGNGGASPRGGGGGRVTGAQATNGAGDAGLVPGGGGGGGFRYNANQNGGNGADGMVIVYYP